MIKRERTKKQKKKSKKTILISNRISLQTLYLFSFIDDEIKLLEIIANYGPVAAAVNALPWQHYVSGIIQNDCSGDVKQLNHAVQIVGFDRSGSVPHYIIQNSWGSDFGENGYMRIAFGKNICGIASQVSLAKLSS